MRGGIQCRFTSKSRECFNLLQAAAESQHSCALGAAQQSPRQPWLGPLQPDADRMLNTPWSSRHSQLLTALPALVCSNFSQRRGFMHICYPASVDEMVCGKHSSALEHMSRQHIVIVGAGQSLGRKYCFDDFPRRKEQARMAMGLQLPFFKKAKCSPEVLRG